MTALQTVTNVASLHPLAVDMRNNIRIASNQNKCVYLFWVKAHAGLEGNERANQLAKEAPIKSKKKPDYDMCPDSFVERIIRTESLEEWSTQYKSSDTAEVTRLFFPDAITAYQTTRKLTHTHLTTQALTSHGGFSSYLNRFKCKDSTSCACDPDTPETLPHFLSECPIHALERINIEIQTGVAVKPENFAELISGEHRKIFKEILY